MSGSNESESYYDRNRIETLIGQAHSLFDKTHIFEFFLADKNEITGILADFYRPIEDEKVDRYLEILDQLIYKSNGK